MYQIPLPLQTRDKRPRPALTTGTKLSDPVQIKISFETKSFFDSTGGQNIARSHLDVAAINQFESRGVRHIFQLHTHLSVIPYLLRGKTQGELNNIVDQKVAGYQSELASAVNANQKS